MCRKLLRNIKKNIGQVLLRDNKFSHLLIRINLELFHPELCERRHSFGNQNPDKTFYVIKFDDANGLLTIVQYVLSACQYAESRGWIPVVDFRETKMQYVSEKDRQNVWEIFFKQPSPYTLEEVYASQKVIFLSRAVRWQSPHFRITEAMQKPEALERLNKYISNKLILSDDIERKVTIAMQERRLEDSLGVSLRGTDYTSLKPAGHPIQPNIEQVISKIHEYLAQHTISKIFLVTEDETIYHIMKQEFGELIDTYGNRYIQKYDGLARIANYINEPNEQGREYLIRTVLLSKCKALIGGNNGAAQFAILLNGGAYEYRYIFDLGEYE